jgi:NADH-quinone oxidoreductase subunit M
LLPLVGVIVFTGLYPKPMLDRIEPSVDKLIEHVSEKTGYVEPQPVGIAP